MKTFICIFIFLLSLSFAQNLILKDVLKGLGPKWSVTDSSVADAIELIKLNENERYNLFKMFGVPFKMELVRDNKYQEGFFFTSDSYIYPFVSYDGCEIFFDRNDFTTLTNSHSVVKIAKENNKYKISQDYSEKPVGFLVKSLNNKAVNSEIINNNYEIFLIDTNFNKLNISNSPNTDDIVPFISPDGEFITYISEEKNGNQKLYLFDGDCTKVIFDEGFVADTRFSLQSDKLIFHDYNGRIWYYNLLKGELKKITKTTQGYFSSLNFYPSGDKILCYGIVNYCTGIFIVNLNENTIERIGSYIDQYNIALSPNGTEFYFKYNTYNCDPSNTEEAEWNSASGYIYKASLQDIKRKEDMLYELKNFKATDITNVCIKTIKTSSELDKKYKTENLIDDDFSTAWVEGASGNGIGEYIDIEFKDYYISSIFLCNGYAKNENIYNANNKIKSLKMNVKYKNYYSENYTEEEEILNLDNRYFSEFNTKYSFYFLDPIFGDVETRISKYKVDKIRLTINDVYRGSKYNDTCVSEIKVYGYLK